MEVRKIVVEKNRGNTEWRHMVQRTISTVRNIDLEKSKEYHP